MKSTINFILTTSLFLAIGCSKDRSNTTSGIVKTDLLKIEDALNHSDAVFTQLVNSIRGRVGTNGSGSKVIWSQKNNYNLGLFVSANHVYGISLWPSLNEEFIDIKSVNNGIYLGSTLPSISGNTTLTNELIASFALYHPAIPSNATNTTILPENDFYLGIMDNQRIMDDGFGNYPNLVQTSIPLQLYDPDNTATSSQTWSVPNQGDTVLAIGYPQDKTAYPNGAVATGKVYTDEEARNIIQSLNLNGDPEGSIPYNPQVEFLANIEATAGMSGGGIFNSNGQLLGIMVRATQSNGEPVLRVVRMRYIVQKLKGFYNALTTADKNKLHPFISGELN